jgi:hypothetical protein
VGITALGIGWKAHSVAKMPQQPLAVLRLI